jgi:hypothetical protein
MLERDLASAFDDAFITYNILKPNNRAAGWPDRVVQMNGSICIMVELKTTMIRVDNRIMITGFEKEQAAFMYKWQRANGFCFLLTAVLDRDAKLMGLIIVQPIGYREWLTIRHRLLEMDQLNLLDMHGVLQWFRSTYNKRDRYIKH